MLDDITMAELRHLVWRNRGIRVPMDSPRDHLIDLLTFKKGVNPTDNPLNKKRDELIEFIKENTYRLSLPCNGNCYEHHDAIVVNCYTQLVESNDNASTEEAGSPAQGDPEGPEPAHQH